MSGMRKSALDEGRRRSLYAKRKTGDSSVGYTNSLFLLGCGSVEDWS